MKSDFNDIVNILVDETLETNLDLQSITVEGALSYEAPYCDISQCFRLKLGTLLLDFPVNWSPMQNMINFFDLEYDDEYLFKLFSSYLGPLSGMIIKVEAGQCSFYFFPQSASKSYHRLKSEHKIKKNAA